MRILGSDAGNWKCRLSPDWGLAGNGATNGVSPPPPSAPLSGYKMPPQAIADIVDRASPPGVSLSPDRKKVHPLVLSNFSNETLPDIEDNHASGRVQMQVLQMYYPPQHPPITELARDELKLAGQSLVTCGPSCMYIHGLGMLHIDTATALQGVITEHPTERT